VKTETYVCQACGVDVVRLVARGQRPKWCPDCRNRGVKGARDCACCGTQFLAWRDGKYCSQLCYLYDHHGPQVSRLPRIHPVVIAQRPEPKPKVRKRSGFTWRTPRECAGCGSIFCPLYTPTMITCSLRCQRRVCKRRRRAREHNTANTWRWSDFMRIARKFDFCCAYCGDRPGQLEPDHVIPLSRGGTDSASNLLPSCHLCNADKNAKTLPEWAQWRAERGKPMRRTTWSITDKRYTHLTDALLAA